MRLLKVKSSTLHSLLRRKRKRKEPIVERNESAIDAVRLALWAVQPKASSQLQSVTTQTIQAIAQQVLSVELTQKVSLIRRVVWSKISHQ